MEFQGELRDLLDNVREAVWDLMDYLDGIVPHTKDRKEEGFKSARSLLVVIHANLEDIPSDFEDYLHAKVMSAHKAVKRIDKGKLEKAEKIGSRLSVEESTMADQTSAIADAFKMLKKKRDDLPKGALPELSKKLFHLGDLLADAGIVLSVRDNMEDTLPTRVDKGYRGHLREEFEGKSPKKQERLLKHIREERGSLSPQETGYFNDTRTKPDRTR
ncbi:MAG: hypothetical protein EB060_07540 [Proteobacteria bacterium]|nr:hypothetical protein [Pseudomonadota bacterium]